MNVKDRILSSAHIEAGHTKMVEDLVKDGNEIACGLSGRKAHLLHMALGVAGESGELVDAIKKHVIYGKDLDIENVIEELGDLEFYIKGIMQTLMISRDQILVTNVSKLTKRYSTGTYSNEQAQTRADKQQGDN